MRGISSKTQIGLKSVLNEQKYVSLRGISSKTQVDLKRVLNEQKYVSVRGISSKTQIDLKSLLNEHFNSYVSVRVRMRKFNRNVFSWLSCFSIKFKLSLVCSATMGTLADVLLALKLSLVMMS